MDFLAKVICRSEQELSTSINERTSIMAAMLGKYESEIDNITPSPSPGSDCTAENKADVVALTGSTGAVGSYILYGLLQNDRVSHVCCLSRAHDSQILQKPRNSERRVPTELPSDRVPFLTVDLTKHNFGLDEEMYNRLLSTTTQVIHNAWPVNFNQTLQSFQPSLDGVLG